MPAMQVADSFVFATSPTNHPSDTATNLTIVGVSTLDMRKFLRTSSCRLVGARPVAIRGCSSPTNQVAGVVEPDTLPILSVDSLAQCHLDLGCTTTHAGVALHHGCQ
jgi:hypothetical protein